MNLGGAQLLLIEVSSQLSLYEGKRVGLPRASEQHERTRTNKEEERGKEELPHEEDSSSEDKAFHTIKLRHILLISRFELK